MNYTEKNIYIIRYKVLKILYVLTIETRAIMFSGESEGKTK